MDSGVTALEKPVHPFFWNSNHLKGDFLEGFSIKGPFYKRYFYKGYL